MKLKSTLLAATLVLFAASTATAFAVEEHHADAKADKTEAAKAAKKPAKKHSHMEEKTGMPMPEPGAKQGDMKNMDRHEHMKMHDHTHDRH